MEATPIRVCATAHSACLFWDKPDAAGPETRYELHMDGAPIGITRQTHFTIEALPPDTAHEVTLFANGQTLGVCRFRTHRSRRRLNVRDWGAAGDGVTMDTSALQRAIDACEADQEVYLPAGVYRTGALRLHSDMALYLDQGAVLQGTDVPEDYLPRILSRFEGTELMCYSSLLNLGTLDHTAGPNCANVLIYGKGTIASGGQALASRVIEQERQRLKPFLEANAALVASCENDRTIPGRVRPRLINLSNCANVRISGLTLKNGASWNVHMIYSEHIVTDHCTFISEGVWNGDGWDPDSSTDCAVFACRFYTGDDSVAIKSGKNPEGNQIGRPSRRIRVFDCHIASGHGICVGSEMSGGVEDVAIWDCDLSCSLYGLEIKGTAKRGGYVRAIRVRDCALPRVLLHSVAYNDDGVPADHPPCFEGFRFERLRLTGRALALSGEWSRVPPVEVEGFAVPGYAIRDVVFRDCALAADAGPLKLRLCENIAFENLTCE